VTTAADEVLAGNIIGGGLALRGGMLAGEVDDLIIGLDGRLKTLVVSAALNGTGYDHYAYPFVDEVRFNAHADVYTADISRDEARRLPRFDSRALDLDASAVGASGSAGAHGEIRSDDWTETKGVAIDNGP
jgi:hypothetical protein